MGWWAVGCGLPAVSCRLPAVGLPLSSVRCPLTGIYRPLRHYRHAPRFFASLRMTMPGGQRKADSGWRSNRLSAIGCRLTAIVCPLSAERYLPAFETLTARTGILRFAQNDDARRKAVSGKRLAEQSAVGCRLSAYRYRLSVVRCPVVTGL